MAEVISNIAQVNFPYIMIMIGEFNATWSRRGTNGKDAPDYFISLSYKNINNKVPEGSLSITYAPMYGEDPALIEKAIVKNKGNLLFRYGYQDIHYQLKLSPWFVGFITNYTNTLGKGNITYNIKFISYSAAFTYSPNRNYTLKFGNPAAVLNLIEGISHDCMTMKYENGEMIPFKSPVSYYLSRKDCVTDFQFPDKLLDGDNGFSVNVNRNGPFAAIREIVKRLEFNSGTLTFTDRWILRSRFGLTADQVRHLYKYVLVIDDTVKSSSQFDFKFYIKEVKASKPTATFTFKWGTKNSDVVDWDPQYNGQIALALSRSDGDSLQSVTTTDLDGRLSYLPGGKNSIYNYKDITAMGGVEYSTDLPNLIEKSNLSKYEYDSETVNYYKATMKIFGNLGDDDPNPVNMGDYIEVIPMIYDKEHFSKGIYWVEGIQHTIDSSGFFTTLSLIKVDEKGYTSSTATSSPTASIK